VLNLHLAGWQSRTLSSITSADICARHAEMGEAGSPTNANRMVALVQHMFNCAADWGLFTGANLATRIKLFKEQSRDRFVTQDELPHLWAALQREPNPYCAGGVLYQLVDRCATIRSLGDALGGFRPRAIDLEDPRHEGGSAAPYSPSGLGPRRIAKIPAA